MSAKRRLHPARWCVMLRQRRGFLSTYVTGATVKQLREAHFISFLAFVTTGRVQMVKLYPEGNAETRLQLRGKGV